VTNWVYAERPASNTIFTVDPATLALGPTITLPAGPATPSLNDTYAMTPDLSTLLVGVPGPGTGGTPSVIYQIDTATNTITHTMTLPGSQLISGLVGGIPGAATNQFAYFAARSNGTNAQIAIVTIATGTLTMFSVPNTIVNGGANLSELCITPDLSQVWCPAQGISPNFFGGMLVMDTLSVSPSTTFIPIPLVAGHNSSCQQPIATIDSKFVYTGEGNANTVAWKFDTATKTLLNPPSPIALSNPNGFNLGPMALDNTNTNIYLGQASFAGPPFGNIEVINIATAVVTTSSPLLDNVGFSARKTGNVVNAYFVQITPGAVIIIPNASPATFTNVALPFAGGYCEVSADGKKLWVSSGVAGSGVMVMDTTTHAITSVTFPTGLATVWNTAGNGTTTPPVTLKVGDLFIPRKGRAGLGGEYQPDDYIIDWLAIEHWANHEWSPAVTNLYIPAKPIGRAPTTPELDQNWLTIERWADGLGTVGGVAIPPLTIPRKTSLWALDLDIDWLEIQRWANSLNP
jgi:hypothetical protein